MSPRAVRRNDAVRSLNGQKHFEEPSNSRRVVARRAVGGCAFLPRTVAAAEHRRRTGLDRYHILQMGDRDDGNKAFADQAEESDGDMAFKEPLSLALHEGRSGGA